LFSENFIQIIFPFEEGYNELDNKINKSKKAQVEAQVEAQVVLKILELLQTNNLSSKEIALKLGHKVLSGNLRRILPVLRNQEYIEYTLPNKPASRLQKYRLTQKGTELLKKILKKDKALNNK